MKLTTKRAVLLLLHTFKLKYSHEKPGWDFFHDKAEVQHLHFQFGFWLGLFVCLFVYKANLNFGTWEL